MSQLWRQRIIDMIVSDKGNLSKRKFLLSVLDQTSKYGTENIPTAQQLRILRPMWEKYEQRQVADFIGECVSG